MNFKQLREAATLTQEALAEKSGVHQTTISAIETGKIKSPQYSTVVALATALERPPDVVAAAITTSVEHAA